MKGTVSSIVLFIVNIVFFLFGTAVMIFGIIALADPSLVVSGLSYIPGYTTVNYIVDLNQVILSSGIVLTVVGSVIFLMCFIGLVGTCSDRPFMLGTYIGFVVLTLFFELAVIIYLGVVFQPIQNRVQSLMYQSLVQNFKTVQINSGVITNSTSPAAAAWETLQFTYGCCGSYGYTDFMNFSSWKQDFISPVPNPIVPPSCCVQIVGYEYPPTTASFVDLNTCLSSAPKYTNTKGCFIAMIDTFAVQAHVTQIVFASLIAVEVIVLILSMHLCGIKKHRFSETDTFS